MKSLSVCTAADPAGLESRWTFLGCVHCAGMSTHGPPNQLNNIGCYIRYAEGRGRGVYASRSIPAHSLIESSPVILFTKEEYDAHGKYTILDCYTFNWKNGQRALALGLGSLFNHADTPNVSYALDTSTKSIRFTTTRIIDPDEELCIFYNHKLWFLPAGSSSESSASCVRVEAEQSNGDCAMFNCIGDIFDSEADEIVPEDQLPFTRLKLVPDNEEEELSAVRTVEAWVVDVQDPKQIAACLKWLKQSNLESTDVGHLKRIRRLPEKTTLLLGISFPPGLPANLQLGEPYTVPVPRMAALTAASLNLKSSFWPTLFTPRKKNEPEPWSTGRVRWAREAFRAVVKEATKALAEGELPIASCVPIPYDDPDSLPVSFIARDSRMSTGHPLRHAIINVIRQVADYRTAQPAPPTPGPDSASPSSGSRKGANYLLTSLLVFTTHEPCLMCSMALLHSRVKEVFYLVPMGRTGGCGGLACLPKLEGVNHRYGICVWKEDEFYSESIRIDPNTDA